MPESINEIQDRIIGEFSVFDDWMAKYEHLIDYGNSLSLISEQDKIDDNLVKGCQSRVWLNATMENGILTFHADSEAMITKGLVSLIIQVLSGHKPEDILNTELYFIDRIGLKEHLSPNRSNGLTSMIKQMKYYALIYNSQKT